MILAILLTVLSITLVLGLLGFAHEIRWAEVAFVWFCWASLGVVVLLGLGVAWYKALVGI